MRHHPDAVMLFAAGFGTRMRPLTDHRPKPLIEVGGQSLLDHALALVTDAGIAKPVVNAHYLADQIVAHLSDRGIPVSVETPEILDTGGGLRHALPLLDMPDAVFTLNTDAVWTGANPLLALAQAWDPARMAALMMLIPAAKAHGHKGSGDFRMDADGRLTRGGAFVYTGAQIMKTELLDGAPDGPFSLSDCWARAADRSALFGILHTGSWCDVGHPGGIPEAEALLAAAEQG